MGSKGGVKFTIAWSDNYRDKNSDLQKKVHFITCVAWGEGRSNYAMKYGETGLDILIAGVVTQNKWQTPEGVKRSSISVRADIIQIGLPPSRIYKRRDGNDRGGQGHSEPCGDSESDNAADG